MQTKCVLKKLALLLAAIAVAGVTAEIALRVMKPVAVGVSHQPCIYEPAPGWGYRYKPNSIGLIYRNFEMNRIVRINSMGFHDVEHDLSEPADPLRIVAVGDSFTAAIHVPVAQGWTQTLQRILQNRHSQPVQVINLGLDSTGTDVHLAILEQYLSVLKPDVVILAFYANDVHDVQRGLIFRECYRGHVINYQNNEQQQALRRIVDEHDPLPAIAWLFDNLYLTRLTRLMPFFFGSRTRMLTHENYMSPSLFGMPEVIPPQSPDANVLFESFLRLAEQHGFRLLVIPVPTKEAALASLARLQNFVAPRVLKQLTIIDVQSRMKAELDGSGKEYEDMFWRNDGHFNAEGNRVYALAVAAAIRRQIGRAQQ